MSLEGTNVIIVGGSSGIGLATADAALGKGARVTVTGRSRERLSEARATLGDQAEAVAVDALDESAMGAFFEAQDTIDHVFVTVGSYVPDHHLEGPIDTIRGPLDTRLFAALHAAKFALPRMAPRGSMVLLSGTASLRPLPGASVTSASCGAVEALARSLAVDFAPIRVNALRAGYFDTPFLDAALGDQRATVIADVEAQLLVGRIGRPEEAAAAVLFLMENGYVTGSCLTIDGGGALA